jgi:hypothetical protein
MNERKGARFKKTMRRSKKIMVANRTLQEIFTVFSCALPYRPEPDDVSLAHTIGEKFANDGIEGRGHASGL